eukprot:gnl/TRDRNA2_/TRDRNA2_68612_c0_seq1.p1 gnl/TRDRNA2_/TRDRNA2_68612_c0~~gnl/TRDRNA2_/TRDRNA2_68612_c0_seq1.p1  ORF type:complete len:251 (-),score=60.71 gnl/TRDRNA2_/TRDRNA2_68612_c0_seq1:206-931(-)
MAETTLAVQVSRNAQGGEWLTDYVLHFMRSPSWAAPISEFIDSKCSIFDSAEEDENKLEYTTVHNDFQDLVNSLLAAHLLEVDVSPDDFAASFQEYAKADVLLDSIVDQLVSAGDFMVFKKMMVARRLDLQGKQHQQIRERLRMIAAGFAENSDTAAAKEESEAHAVAEAEEVTNAADKMARDTGAPAAVEHVPTPARQPSRANRISAIIDNASKAKTDGNEKAAIVRSALTASIIKSRRR